MVHELCAAQANFAKATQVLEEKIEDKNCFLKYHLAGTATCSTNARQNGGRN